MYKVQIFSKGKELPTQQLWETQKEAEEMERLYKVFFESKGAKGFTFKIIEVSNN
ncbi:MAG: hypothetical protein RSF40_01705 [Oscillospiraceae bacterium]